MGLAHDLPGVEAHIDGYDFLKRHQPIIGIRRHFALGFANVLRRPAILVDAFDAKCSDYRNVALNLADVGFIAALEMGEVFQPTVSKRRFACSG